MTQKKILIRFGLENCFEFGLPASENAIFLSASPESIATAKDFGFLTCAITGNYPDKNVMFEAEPDFSFFVASEIEKYVDALSNDEVPVIKSFAMENNVPIMQDEGVDFICNYIKQYNVKRILEIGTAIGYSALRFAEIDKNIKVVSIEIDNERYKKALENVKNRNLESQIQLIFADALECDVNDKFDLIFIDAAKAQYIKFFEKYKKNLSLGGAIISDNLLFHGMVENENLTHNYSTKKLVRKIKNYRNFLENNTEFSTKFYEVGDGIAVSEKVNGK